MARKNPIPKRKQKPPIKKVHPLDALIKKRKPTLNNIRSLVLEIKGFLQPAQRFSEAIGAFNTQSALQTAQTRKVPVIYGASRHGGLAPSFGCYTQSKLLLALLQRMKVKSRLCAYFVKDNGQILIDPKPHFEVREIKTLGTGRAETHRAHASIFFELGGKTYNADPFFGIVYEIPPRVLEKIEVLKKHGRFKDISKIKVGFSEFAEMQRVGKL